MNGPAQTGHGGVSEQRRVLWVQTGGWGHIGSLYDLREASPSLTLSLSLSFSLTLSPLPLTLSFPCIMVYLILHSVY